MFGGEDEYPLIVKTASTNDEAVYYGKPARDSWNVRLLSPSLDAFLLGVIGYLQVYLGSYYGRIYDDDFVVYPHFRQALLAMITAQSGNAPYAETWLAWLVDD